MQVLDNVKPLSEKLMSTIPKLKEGEVAVFRLKNAFKAEGNREDEFGKAERTAPEWFQISGVQIIVDPYEPLRDIKGEIKTDKDGKPIFKAVTKMIGTYIKDYKRMGTGEAKPVYQDLIFIRGEMKLTHDRVAEYEFAMRSIDNETNKYRKQMGAKKEARFYLVGSREVTPFMQLADMKYHSEKMIREASFQVLREIATKMNMSSDAKLHVKSFANGFASNPETMKYEMIQLAQKFPKQIMASTPDTKIKLRVQIYDAQVYGILMFDNSNTYQLDTAESFVEIHRPDADSEKDKVESLIEYFMSDEGKHHYLLFAQTLSKALNVKIA